MIIGIPKALIAARLFAGKDDESAEVPEADDEGWIDVTHSTPQLIRAVSDVLWVKKQDGTICKAFYLRLPGSHHYVWIDRNHDELLYDVKEWRGLIDEHGK